MLINATGSHGARQTDKVFHLHLVVTLHQISLWNHTKIWDRKSEGGVILLYEIC